MESLNQHVNNMQKKIVSIIILMITGYYYSRGQMSITIDSLYLDGVIEVEKKDVIGNLGGGPSATITLSITNVSVDVLSITGHHDYQLYCEYFYDGVSHKSVDLYLTLRENKPLLIPPTCTYSEKVSFSLFSPYNFLEMEDVVIYDHLPKLNDILSSFQLVLIYNGKRYASKNAPIVKKGTSFFLEYK